MKFLARGHFLVLGGSNSLCTKLGKQYIGSFIQCTERDMDKSSSNSMRLHRMTDRQWEYLIAQPL